MQNIKHLFCLSIFSIILITACNKDDDSTSDRENYFFCKIDGEDWESNGISQPTVIRAVIGGTASKRFDFFGTSSNGVQISIIVQDYENADQGECLTENTYYGIDHEQADDNFTVGSGLSNFSQLSVSGNGIARDGFVRITDCNEGKISGTFEFIRYDLLGEVAVTISEGRFDNVDYVFSE